MKSNVYHLLLLKLDSTIHLVYGSGIKNNDEKKDLVSALQIQYESQDCEEIVYRCFEKHNLSFLMKTELSI